MPTLYSSPMPISMEICFNTQHARNMLLCFSIFSTGVPLPMKGFLRQVQCLMCLFRTSWRPCIRRCHLNFSSVDVIHLGQRTKRGASGKYISSASTLSSASSLCFRASLKMSRSDQSPGPKGLLCIRKSVSKKGGRKMALPLTHWSTQYRST